MSKERKIPIQNIFYMLCYAWDILPEDEEINSSGSEKFENIYDFLGTILADKVNELISKGLTKEYSEFEEPLQRLRGRINISSSLCSMSFVKRKLVCTYDEFNQDILFHKIIKYTIYRLIIYHPDMHPDILDKLRILYPYFTNVGEVPPSERNLSKLRYDRNNIHYLLIMHICEFIYQCHIANESGDGEFLDLEEDDKKMAIVFETFLRNFYKYELPRDIIVNYKDEDDKKSKYKVDRQAIEWRIKSNHKRSKILPGMMTDIVINKILMQNTTTNEWLIADAKYYSKTLAKHFRDEEGGAKKMHVANLYQMYAYLSNWKPEYGTVVKGLIIYPQVFEELDEILYLENDKTIRVATVNLNSGWDSIKKRLLCLVRNYISKDYEKNQLKMGNNENPCSQQ